MEQPSQETMQKMVTLAVVMTCASMPREIGEHIVNAYLTATNEEVDRKKRIESFFHYWLFTSDVIDRVNDKERELLIRVGNHGFYSMNITNDDFDILECEFMSDLEKKTYANDHDQRTVLRKGLIAFREWRDLVKHVQYNTKRKE